jgi:Sigma-70 region 2
MVIMMEGTRFGNRELRELGGGRRRGQSSRKRQRRERKSDRSLARTQHLKSPLDCAAPGGSAGSRGRHGLAPVRRPGSAKGSSRRAFFRPGSPLASSELAGSLGLSHSCGPRDQRARFEAFDGGGFGQRADRARIRAGDPLALRALYARHSVKVYRFALRLLRSDVASEVFTDLWRNAGGFEGRSEASTFLLAMARNKAY